MAQCLRKGPAPVYTDESYLCDFEVWAFASYAYDMVQARFLELGKEWPVTDADKFELISLFMAQSYQESGTDKKRKDGTRYCGFNKNAQPYDHKNKCYMSSAYGCMQILKGTWEDIADRILQLPASKRYGWETHRHVPAVNFYYGIAYMFEMYLMDKAGSRSWDNALARFWGGGNGHKMAYGKKYAAMIRKWQKQWTDDMKTTYALGAPGFLLMMLPSMAIDMRREFK